MLLRFEQSCLAPLETFATIKVMPEVTDDKSILFYDGDCALCNFWVQFLMERDRKKKLFYSPLQGETAKKLLTSEMREQVSTVVLWHQQKLFTKSNAILNALKQINYSPDTLVLGHIIPTSLRDRMYDFVASNRYRWFGKKETCPLPPEGYQQQFLA